MFEPEVFGKQIYCIEENTCDIVGAFGTPRSDSAVEELRFSCPYSLCPWLYETIWRHCSTPQMQQASHSRVPDCARCFCQTITKSCKIANNIDKILPKFCNIFFIKRFTFSMTPIVFRLLKLI